MLREKRAAVIIYFVRRLRLVVGPRCAVGDGRRRDEEHNDNANNRGAVITITIITIMIITIMIITIIMITINNDNYL